MERLGLGHIDEIKNIKACNNVEGAYGRAMELSKEKTQLQDIGN